MKITSMQKMIAVVVLFVIVAALAVVFGVMPMFTQLTDLDAQKAQAQQQVQSAQALLARLESAKSRSAVTEAQLLKVGTQMPDSPQLPTLMVEMQNLADEAGVSVTAFSPGQPSPSTTANYTEIPITTAVTAQWDDLLDYLHRLQNSTRLLRVTNVSIAPDSSSTTTVTAGEEANLTVTLAMKAYVIGNNGKIIPSAPATPAAPPAAPAQ